MRRLTRIAATLCALAVLSNAVLSRPHQRRSAAPAAPASGADWPVYLGGAASTHYSSLTQINRSNVSKLTVAWTFDTGDAFERSEMQCNPIVVGGVLYATTPKLNVIALDAAKGTLLWRFDPNAGEAVVGTMRNRGLTYWSDGKDSRIFVTARQYLYALDAKTGKPVPGFGGSGRVDLRDGLRPGESQMVSMTTPGVVYRDLLVCGSITSETLPTAPGDVRAYDVRTGKLRWTFHTIPRPGERGYETWPDGAWQYTGSANNWTGMALDEKRGIVFVPTGSAAYDFYGANREGDNLYANCLLALDAATGKRIWHFQTVRHDIWDRDLPSPPTLVTVRRDGRLVDAVAQPTKSGFVYLFERATGKPLFPIEYRKVPPSDIPGEKTADTQPLPTAPEPFARQRLTAEMLTQRTPEAHRAVLERFLKVRSGGQFVPGSREGTVIFPGYDGGAEWGGAAYDPETGLLYVHANEMAWVLTIIDAPPRTKQVSARELYTTQCASCHGSDMKGAPPEFPPLVGISERHSDAEISKLLFQGSGRMPSFAHLGTESVNAIVGLVAHGENKTVAQPVTSPTDMRYLSDGYKKFLDPDGYPAIAPPWGTLNAIDLNTGRYAWRIPFGEYPELAAKGLANTGSENYGGAVVTAGGLVFIGATSYDRKFRAFDKGTGKLLWETELNAGGNATPAVYSVNGRQFVVIGAGGGKSGAPSGGSYYAFALPDK